MVSWYGTFYTITCGSLALDWAKSERCSASWPRILHAQRPRRGSASRGKKRRSDGATKGEKRARPTHTPHTTPTTRLGESWRWGGRSDRAMKRYRNTSSPVRRARAMVCVEAQHTFEPRKKCRGRPPVFSLPSAIPRFKPFAQAQGRASATTRRASSWALAGEMGCESRPSSEASRQLALLGSDCVSPAACAARLRFGFSVPQVPRLDRLCR